jgi:hypothetical protein
MRRLDSFTRRTRFVGSSGNSGWTGFTTREKLLQVEPEEPTDLRLELLRRRRSFCLTKRSPTTAEGGGAKQMRAAVKTNGHQVEPMKLSAVSLGIMERTPPECISSSPVPQDCWHCRETMPGVDGYVYRGKFYCDKCIANLAEAGEFYCG